MLINNVFKPNILTNLFDLFFPESCINCGDYIQVKGQYLCIFCNSELALTDFSTFPQNGVETTFRGRLPIEAGTALLFFDKKSMTQKVLHELKYRGRPEIGIFIGRWLAAEMKLSKRFNTLDVVIPVPLHHRKQKRRGYNQVTLFAETIAKELNLMFLPDTLIKKTDNVTQTKRNRFERIWNENSDYDLRDAETLKGRHILLVDDVITSGATMEACSLCLLKVEGIRLSIASMAFTS